MGRTCQPISRLERGQINWALQRDSGPEDENVVMVRCLPFIVMAALFSCSAQETPTNADDTTAPAEHMTAITSALTAYFKTHGLTASSPVAKGLTVPWVAADKLHVSGHLVATGERSENGCPEFLVLTRSFRRRSATRWDKSKSLLRIQSRHTLPLCPWKTK